MSCSVLPGRLVAAAYVAARHAETKVHPIHSQLEALLASVRGARRYVANDIEMAAL